MSVVLIKPSGKKQKQKGRKLGRNTKWCHGYFLIGTKLKNKRRKLRRHLKESRHVNDKQGLNRYKELGGTIDW